MSEVEETLRRHGATVQEALMPAEFADVLARHRIVMAVEAAAFHELRLKRHPEDYGPNITKLLCEGLSCPALEYQRAKELQQQLPHESHRWFPDADALLLSATT